ncbi:hypothetical protein [Actinoplanes solisilvae]|uniref:hypothetical protein n=1 Tax=Actinoplanes solisilvae TaxID=2486853 RepID=UPI000FDCD8E8|nr:hypothetical protein [Actinoplanes solisilvae]
MLGRAVFVDSVDGVPAAVAALGLGAPRPVLVLVGGAGGLTGSASSGAVLTDVIAPAVRAHAAAAVDGGTDSGVMRLLGRAAEGFPLVGVAALDTVTYPGHTHNPIADAAPLEPHHTHFVLAREGRAWGDEAPYLAAAATALAAGRPSVTVLINGGELTLNDAEHSLAEGRPVLVLSGTGRAADRIAAHAGERAAAIARSPLVRVVDVTDRDRVAAGLDELLSG